MKPMNRIGIHNMSSRLLNATRSPIVMLPDITRLAPTTRTMIVLSCPANSWPGITNAIIREIVMRRS